jgi:hypothetical protein
MTLYVVSRGQIDKMAGFLERAMVLEDYRGHGSGAFVFVFVHFVVEALISSSGCGFSYLVSLICNVNARVLRLGVKRRGEVVEHMSITV